jgi:hypothetical protein
MGLKKSSALFIVLISLCLFAKAQVYLGVGGFPYGEVMSTDLTLELHIGPTATDKFALGARGQLAFAYQAVYSSICLTADYYFSRPENGLRIFAGGGFGPFDESKENNHANNPNNTLGLFPRIGIEAGHFRLSAEYDITGGINNYAAVNLGFFF